jgi:molybdate transport system substrate-binding protein
MARTALQLLSSMATRELLVDLATQYARASSQSVDARAAGGVDVARRVGAGEPVDVVVLASDAIDKLVAQGRLFEDSRTDLARSGIAVAVRNGARPPDIGSEQALRRAVEAAPRLGYSTGPSGVYIEKLFARWGLLETLRSRAVIAPPGVAVGSLLADGTVDLGFQQLSEFISLPGITVVGPLPAAVQSITTFSGAVAVACANLQSARELLAFLGSVATEATKLRHGLQAP